MPSATTARSVVDVLRAAKERISDPERWTTGEAARNAQGEPVASVADPDACKWCALGSVEREGQHFPECDDLLEKAAGDLSVFQVNDHEGHAAALALFDKAIELAEAGQ